MKLQSTTDPIQTGDCRDVLEGWQSGDVQLVVADPPFNNGTDYRGYADKRATKDFFAMLREAYAEVYRVLKATGGLFAFMSSEHQAELLVILREIGFHWRNTIVWHQTFGQAQTRKFTPSWTAIHHVVKDPGRATFNADAVRVPSARQLVYGDKRANPLGKVPDDVWVLLPGQQAPEAFDPAGDLWLVPRVCGTFRERADHANQLPTALVERIVRVASDPGDLVLDPFAGSGTVPLVAARLGRRGVGIEIDPDTADVARQRIAADAERN